MINNYDKKIDLSLFPCSLEVSAPSLASLLSTLSKVNLKQANGLALNTIKGNKK